MIRSELRKACFGYSIHGECSVVEVDVENSADLAVVVANMGNVLDSEGTEKECVISRDI